MEPPLIVRQMTYAAERLERVIRGEDVSVFVFGPTGTGKTQLVDDICEKFGVRQILCQNMTKTGFLDLLRKHKTGRKLVVIDDSDEFMADIEFCNLMKQATTNKRRRTITSINHVTLRDGTDSFDTDCRIIVLSNGDPEHVPTRMRNHVQALIGRCPVVPISFDPLELLRYVDYHVCELDYLRRWRVSLATAQQILDTFHLCAWRLRNIDFRCLNEFADEARRNPGGWTEKIKGILRPTPIRDDEPPPAPRILPRSMRRAASEVMTHDIDPIGADKAAGTGTDQVAAISATPNSSDGTVSDEHMRPKKKLLAVRS